MGARHKRCRPRFLLTRAPLTHAAAEPYPRGPLHGYVRPRARPRRACFGGRRPSFSLTSCNPPHRTQTKPTANNHTAPDRTHPDARRYSTPSSQGKQSVEQGRREISFHATESFGDAARRQGMTTNTARTWRTRSVNSYLCSAGAGTQK